MEFISKNGRLDLPAWATLLPVFFNVFVLMIPKSQLRDSLLFPLPFLSILYLWLNFEPQAPFRGVVEPYGVMLMSTAQALITGIFCVLNDPEREYIKQGETKPLAEKNAGLWERLKWAINVAFSMRGVTWNWQVKNIRPGPPKGYSRLLFLRDQGWRLAITVAILIAVKKSAANTPQNALPPKNFWDEPIPRQIWLVWMGNFLGWSQLKTINLGCSMVAVGLGLSEPWEWPPLFGIWSEAYTVRQMWGSTWHQTLRRIFTVYGNWLAHDILGFKKGTFGSRYTQLFLSFFLSGAVHSTATYPLMAKSSHAYQFFLLQAVIIFIEDHVIKAAKAAGLQFNMFWRIFGYLWVFFWFTVSQVDWCARLIDMGVWIS